jgi:DNA modification methylase
VQLSDFFVKAFSNEGDLIVDPFAGSGTVAVSCEELKRNYVMIDKEPYNVSLMRERLKKNNCG